MNAPEIVKAARFVLILLAWWVIVPTATVIDARPPAAPRQESVPLPREWVGKWEAPQYKVALSSDFHVSVWGRGASAVRDVALDVEPDGEGILKVFNSVVDRQGRTKPYSASLTEAHLVIRADTDAPERRPIVTVRSAETRYLDNSSDRTPVPGLTVKLLPVPGNANVVNLRFDLERGTGSFGETLHRS